LNSCVRYLRWESI